MIETIETTTAPAEPSEAGTFGAETRERAHAAREDRMRRLGCIGWLVVHRWPVILVIPIFTFAGYSWLQALVLGTASILLMELFYIPVLHVIGWE